MTQEQYDFLSKYKSNMETSAESGYSRNIRNPERKRIKEIYIELSGDTVVGNIYCMECLPDLLKKVKPYYDAGVTTTGSAPAGTAKPRKGNKKDEAEGKKAESGKGQEPAGGPQGENIPGVGEVSAGAAD